MGTAVGRIGGAGALILGPLFWGIGLLLRERAVATAGFTPAQTERFAAEPFAAREQLSAYLANPALTMAGYATFLLGAILLIPAILILARTAAKRSPWLATLGGTLVVLGLVARLYFAGVEQLAFQLADAQGLETATRTILDTYVDISYGPWRIPVTAAFGQYLGMPLLAVALYRAGVFGGLRTLVLLWWATMWGGVLKAAGLVDVAASLALCIVLVPLAVQLLRGGEPTLRPPVRPRWWPARRPPEGRGAEPPYEVR
jgi:hypothetical protein